MQVNHKVPSALRIWFVIHFAADIAFAIPLFVAPRRFLALLGWTWLGRNEPKEVYLGMLNLKIIWSLSAALGLAISIAQRRTADDLDVPVHLRRLLRALVLEAG